jgi:predicted porin
VATSSAAFAQSNVTLYGVADAAITKSSDESTRLSSSSGLNNGTSRWGVRGTEDLGGGLTAGFNYEAGLNLETGATGQSGGSFFSRAAQVSLGGGWGSVAFGRGKSASGQALPAWELTGDANYSVAVKQFGYAGEASSRNSSQVSYTTPDVGGFTASLATVLKGNRGTAATLTEVAVAGEDAKYDLNVIYKGGPLSAAVSYNAVENGGAKGVQMGAKYDFGTFQLASSYTDSEQAGGAVNNKGFTLGGGVKLGATSLVLDVARDTEAKDTDVLVEAKYALSKRTVAYALYQRDGQGKNSDDTNNVGVGIRHNF